MLARPPALKCPWAPFSEQLCQQGSSISGARQSDSILHVTCERCIDMMSSLWCALQRQVLREKCCCREAAVGHELDCPQQFGIWEVAGVGLVVAFRGTASAEDVFIDTNIEPVPLDATGGLRGASQSAILYCFLTYQELLISQYD